MFVTVAGIMEIWKNDIFVFDRPNALHNNIFPFQTTSFPRE